MKECIICKKEIPKNHTLLCRSDTCLKIQQSRYALKCYYKNKQKTRKKRNAYYQKIKNNPEFKKKKSKIAKIWRKKIKRTVLEKYGGKPPKCACCGEKQFEFLSVDHINKNGAEHRRKIGRGSKIFQWLNKKPVMRNEFQILCFNCNCSRNIYGECPHKNPAFSF